MMGLHESHARWKLGVVAGEWHHMNPPAQAPPQGAAPHGQDPRATDPVRGEIALLEARLAQVRGPSIPQLSLGELQRYEYTAALRMAPPSGGDARHFSEVRGTAARLRSMRGGNCAGRRHVGRLVADPRDQRRRIPGPRADPAGREGGPPWGLLQVRAARPLGARMQHAAVRIPALSAVATAVGGAAAGTAGVPGRRILCPRGPDPIHGVKYRVHV